MTRTTKKDDLQPLLDGLKAEKSEDRQRALWALKDTNDPEALPNVYAAFESDPDLNVRAVALRALCGFTCPEIYDYLVRAAQGRKDVPRFQLPEALAKGGEKSIRHLWSMALDQGEDGGVRIDALERAAGFSPGADPAVVVESIAANVRVGDGDGMEKSLAGR